MSTAETESDKEARSILEQMRSGGNGGEDTPVPIPNTAVKLFCAEGTWTEGSWESRSLPGLRGQSESTALLIRTLPVVPR